MWTKYFGVKLAFQIREWMFSFSYGKFYNYHTNIHFKNCLTIIANQGSLRVMHYQVQKGINDDCMAKMITTAFFNYQNVYQDIFIWNFSKPSCSMWYTVTWKGYLNKKCITPEWLNCQHSDTNFEWRIFKWNEYWFVCICSIVLHKPKLIFYFVVFIRQVFLPTVPSFGAGAHCKTNYWQIFVCLYNTISIFAQP